MPISNQTRAERAQNALQAYVEAKGEVFEKSRDEIIDLIADLLHLLTKDHVADHASAKQEDDAVRAALDMAEMHFDAERSEAEG